MEQDNTKIKILISILSSDPFDKYNLLAIEIIFGGLQIEIICFIKK